MILLPHAILALAVLLLQPLDVVSTNAALKQPDVVEVGDTGIGLGNTVAWAMTLLGRWWWIVKLPFLIFAPLVWTPVPIAAEPALVALLLTFTIYFARITRQNFINARPRQPQERTCVPLA